MELEMLSFFVSLRREPGQCSLAAPDAAIGAAKYFTIGGKRLLTFTNEVYILRPLSR